MVTGLISISCSTDVETSLLHFLCNTISEFVSESQGPKT